jgi:hypothetical protein
VQTAPDLRFRGSGLTIDEIHRRQELARLAKALGSLGTPETVDRLYGWKGVLESQEVLIKACRKQGAVQANGKLTKPLEPHVASQLEAALIEARELVAKLRVGEEPDFALPPAEAD